MHTLNFDPFIYTLALNIKVVCIIDLLVLVPKVTIL